jgi:hypothetical protein
MVVLVLLVLVGGLIAFYVVRQRGHEAAKEAELKRWEKNRRTVSGLDNPIYQVPSEAGGVVTLVQPYGATATTADPNADLYDLYAVATVDPNTGRYVVGDQEATLCGDIESDPTYNSPHYDVATDGPAQEQLSLAMMDQNSDYAGRYSTARSASTGDGDDGHAGYASLVAGQLTRSLPYDSLAERSTRFAVPIDDDSTEYIVVEPKVGPTEPTTVSTTTVGATSAGFAVPIAEPGEEQGYLVVHGAALYDQSM